MLAIEDYILQRLLIKGSHYEIYYSTQKTSTSLYAIKKIPVKYINDKDNAKYKNSLNNSIYINKQLTHPNILKHHDIKMTANNIYLIYEYCNGSTLKHCLEKYVQLHSKPPNELIAQCLIKQLAAVIKYMNEKNFMYRGLNLDNILVHFDDEDGIAQCNLAKCILKLKDFRFVTWFSKDKLLSQVAGYPQYMDPNLLITLANDCDNCNGNSNGKITYEYDERIDIWSLGIICCDIMLGVNYFAFTDCNDIIKKFNTGLLTLPSNAMNISREGIKLINSMLKSNIKERYTIDQVINSEFLNKDIIGLTDTTITMIADEIKIDTCNKANFSDDS